MNNKTNNLLTGISFLIIGNYVYNIYNNLSFINKYNYVYIKYSVFLTFKYITVVLNRAKT